jgi:hypothetical protein
MTEGGGGKIIFNKSPPSYIKFMYIKRKVYSSYIDEYGEERLFSTSEIISEESYLDQREFNSKAAKALNNKYLKQVAAKGRITEIDPRIWKKDARFKNTFYLTSNTPAEMGRERFNRSITDKSDYELGASDLKTRLGKRMRKELYGLEHYDHAGPDSFYTEKGPRQAIIRRLKK